MSFSHRTRLAIASAVLASALPCATVLALDNAQDLRDFVHYTMIAKPDLAKSHLERLLKSGITDAQLSDLVRETMSRDRLDAALMRGRGVSGLRDIVAELESRLDAGEKNPAGGGASAEAGCGGRERGGGVYQQPSAGGVAVPGGAEDGV